MPPLKWSRCRRPSPAARLVHLSMKGEWQIDRDLGRPELHFRTLPDALSRVDQLPFLSAGRRLLSQAQGALCLCVRPRGASSVPNAGAWARHAFDDQFAVEALTRCTEELKHEMFR